MRFTETDPQRPWYHDLQIPAGSSLLDLDQVANVFMARTAAVGRPAMKLFWCGNYREGLKPEQYIKDANDLLREVAGSREVLKSYLDDDFPNESYSFWYTGVMKLTAYSGRAEAEILTDDPSIWNRMREFFKENLVSFPPSGSVYMMTSTQSGPQFHVVGDGGHNLERDNYTDEVMASYDRICQDIKAVTPRGRLSILDGPPGCGKTYLIRGMLSQVTDVLFVVVPPHFLPSLAEPSSLSAVTKLKEEHEKPIVFLVEDADDCLATRDSNNMSAVSMVLNLGDGIIGSVLDIRIVATTNAKHQDLDPAIKRPGRLTAFQTVDALPPEKARSVYKRLTGNEASGSDWNTAKTLAEVYQAAYDSGWRGPRSTEKKMGFTP